eukprot:6979057-Prymnesium_polylepis.2
MAHPQSANQVQRTPAVRVAWLGPAGWVEYDLVARCGVRCNVLAIDGRLAARPEAARCKFKSRFHIERSRLFKPSGAWRSLSITCRVEEWTNAGGVPRGVGAVHPRPCHEWHSGFDG